MKRILALLVLSYAAAAQTAFAGADFWTPTGPPGAYVYDVEYVGTQSGNALAITSRGIFRTVNNGDSWSLVTLVQAHTRKYLAVNPANRNQVLAYSDFLYRSVDGGLSFSIVGAGTPTGAFTGINSVVFGADGTAWAGLPSGVVERSDDAGATWTFVSQPIAGGGTTLAMQADAVNPSLLYAFMADRSYRSNDRGVSWTLLFSGSYSRIAASRTTSGLLFGARVSDSMPVRSEDFGVTWTQTPAQRVYQIETVSGSTRTLGLDDDARAVVSNDNGITWTTRGRVPTVFPWAVALDPLDPQRALIGTSAGIAATGDGGATWVERNTGMNEAQIVDIVRAPDSSALYVLTNDVQSIYRRDTPAGAWTALAGSPVPLLGYPGTNSSIYEVAISPISPTTLYMSRESSFGRSTDGGSTWTRIAAVPPLADLTLHPTNPLVAFGTANSTVHRTLDGAFTWAPANSGLPEIIADLEFDPRQPDALYAVASGYHSPVSPLFRTVDGGANWTPVPWNGSLGFDGHTVAFEPGNSATIYLGLDRDVYKSTDAGATWLRLTTFPLQGAYQFVFDPQQPNIVYALGTYPNRVARSVDRGATWETPRSDTPELTVLALSRIALVPGTNARLIAVSTTLSRLYELDITPRLSLEINSTTMTAGAAKTMVLSVINSGIYTATRVRLTASLAVATGSYTVQGTGAVCTLTGRDLSCDVGTLPPNVRVTVAIGFTPTVAGSWSASLAAYESAQGGVTTATVTVEAAPAPAPVSPPSGGGGGGGRLDYLMLTLAALLGLRRRSRTR